MRSMWWLILFGVIVAAGTFRAAAVAPPPSPKPVALIPQQKAKVPDNIPKPVGPVPQPKVEVPDNIVDGYGPSAAAARDRALEHAQERVEKLLVARFGESGWKPIPEQLSSDYLIRFGVVQPQGEPVLAPGSHEEKTLVARYKVELNGKYLKEVQRVAREQRVQDRHLVLARVLGGLVVLLLVGAGYLRLEDMTRGYATQLLRVGAFVLVALAAAALWL